MYWSQESVFGTFLENEKGENRILTLSNLCMQNSFATDFSTFFYHKLKYAWDVRHGCNKKSEM